MAQILVVEDDPTLKLTYDILLRNQGHTVFRAEDGEQALKLAQENEVDLILLDLLMPNVDGIEFLRRYDLKNKHPKVRVVVFTNVSMPETFDQAMELGASRYVTKATCSPKELAQIIEEEIAKKK